MMNRRHFTAAATSLLGASLLTRGPVAFAKTPTDKRLIVIVLRGAMDGLHALAPYADRDYAKLRPGLALTRPGGNNPVIDLNGSFGLHPKLTPLKTLFDAKELSFIPAASTSYRARSHFEAQNMLETLGSAPYVMKTGWLNRTLLAMNSGDTRMGLALGPSVPLILFGKAGVRTHSESRLPEVSEDFMDRINAMYDSDPMFHKAISQALEEKEMATGGMMSGAEAMSDMTDMSGMTDMSDMRLRPNNLGDTTLAAATLLKDPDGPRIAVIESGGWDTHYGQERRLSALFTDLAAGLTTIKSELGDVWKDTAVVVVSEFGRTARENGSNGTDHGTGGLAIVAGGAVKGGQILGAWPGLSGKALFEDRDLMPTSHVESIFKTLLRNHMGISESAIADKIFPDLKAIKPISGLIR